MLAQLYASGFLPEVWIADEATQALRRQVTRRNQIVRQRSRLKNIIQSILHAHLIPSCPHADLCGPKGRLSPVPRQIDQILMQRDREAVAVPRRAHGVEPLRHPLRIAVLAALADLRAPGDRVPYISVHSIFDAVAIDRSSPQSPESTLRSARRRVRTADVFAATGCESIECVGVLLRFRRAFHFKSIALTCTKISTA